MRKIFSDQDINTGRQVEIDMLKAVSVVIFMILCHVYEYDTDGYKSSLTWLANFFLGGLAAPAFMFAMGFVWIVSLSFATYAFATYSTFPNEFNGYKVNL